MATSNLPPSFHPQTCLAQGIIEVGPQRHSLYYEQHGDSSPGATRVMLMCGMYSTSSSAINTVSHLTSTGGYSILVFDHRGVGLSSAPSGRYKTSEMAKDTVALLDHVCWVEDRSIHVVGVSLGGMISQEVALLISQRLASLVLVSTRAGPIPELPSLTTGHMLLRQLTRTIKSPEHNADLAIGCLFPKEWLDQPDERAKNEGDTRRVTLRREYVQKAKDAKQTTAGKFGQFLAVSFHFVSRHKLSTVLATIPRVHILVGSEDQLIAPRRSKELHDMILGSTYHLVKGGGHTLPLQFEQEYHGWLEQVFEEAKVKIAEERDRATLVGEEVAKGEDVGIVELAEAEDVTTMEEVGRA